MPLLALSFGGRSQEMAAWTGTGVLVGAAYALAAARTALCQRERVVRPQEAVRDAPLNRCAAPLSFSLDLRASPQGANATALEPEALEKAAKALRDIDNSPNAKKAWAWVESL